MYDVIVLNFDVTEIPDACTILLVQEVSVVVTHPLPTYLSVLCGEVSQLSCTPCPTPAEKLPVFSHRHT